MCWLDAGLNVEEKAAGLGWVVSDMFTGRILVLASEWVVVDFDKRREDEMSISTR